MSDFDNRLRFASFVATDNTSRCIARRALRLLARYVELFMCRYRDDADGESDDGGDKSSSTDLRPTLFHERPRNNNAGKSPVRIAVAI